MAALYLKEEDMGIRRITDAQLAVILKDYKEDPRSSSYYSFKYKIPLSTMNRELTTYFNLQTKQARPGVIFPTLPENWQAIKTQLMQNGPQPIPKKEIPQVVLAPKPTLSSKHCTNCEITWPIEDKFCRKCGTKLFTKSTLIFKAKLKEIVEKVLVYIPPEVKAVALADFKKFDEELESFDAEDN